MGLVEAAWVHWSPSSPGSRQSSQRRTALDVPGMEQVLGHAACQGSLTPLGTGLSIDIGTVLGDQPESWGVTLLWESLLSGESSRVGLTAAWVTELSTQGHCIPYPLPLCLPCSYPSLSRVIFFTAPHSPASLSWGPWAASCGLCGIVRKWFSPPLRVRRVTG